MKQNGLIKGVAILIICNLIGKVLGAVYRIPLARLLGPIGMGIYQLIFPLYCLILTVSTSGVPVAISKLVAEYNSKNQFKNSKKTFKISFLILTFISLIGAISVVVCAELIAKIQGNVNIYVCYFGIAPAILFVGAISALRGYFQGNLLMFPTAISSLIEQIVKMTFGLILAERFLYLGVEYAVLGALFGVSISEVVAFVFLTVCYFFVSRKKRLKNEIQADSAKFLSKQILSLAIPITFGGLIGPLTAMVDSLLVVNLLMFSGYSNDLATTLLGLQSGIVEPLLNIPIIIAISISTVILPNISKFSVENSKEQVNNYISRAIQISLCISVACAICFIIFGKQIIEFLYSSSLDSGEVLTATKLLFFGCFNMIFLSLVQITAGVLQGLNYSKIPVKSLLIGCMLKIIFDLILIPIPSINIFGSVISGAVCYVVVFVLNFVKIKKLTGVSVKNSIFYISIQACFVCLFAFVSNTLCLMIFSDFVSLIVAGVIAVSVFFITYYAFFVYERNVFELSKK